MFWEMRTNQKGEKSEKSQKVIKEKERDEKQRDDFRPFTHGEQRQIYIYNVYVQEHIHVRTLNMMRKFLKWTDLISLQIFLVVYDGLTFAYAIYLIFMCKLSAFDMKIIPHMQVICLPHAIRNIIYGKSWACV